MNQRDLGHKMRIESWLRILSIPLLSTALSVAARGQGPVLLDGDFDNLTVGTAPDRGVPNGAWTIPNAYASTSAGDLREPARSPEIISVVETSSFDGSRSGLSLRLDDPQTGRNAVAVNFLTEPVRETDGGILRVKFDNFVPQGDRVGGGVVMLTSDEGYGGISRWTDQGPRLEWRANGRLMVGECNSFVAKCDPTSFPGADLRRRTVVQDYPRDEWQHVQLDIDLVADKYDLYYSTADAPLELLASDLGFSSGRMRSLDRIQLFTNSGLIGEKSTGYYDNVSVAWLPSTPYQTVTLSGAGGVYQQDFDAALGVDSSADNQPLPAGWIGSRNGLTTTDLTTKAFPTSSVGSGTLIYNAGADQASDRALALGIGRDTSRGTLQLLADVTGADARQLQLAFDLEVWDASTSSTTVTPGEAAFDVSVEIDQGEGFVPLLDLGRVTTGPTLSKPSTAYLDGNDPVNRVTFDSGMLPATVPVGSQLRVNWAADQAVSRGWIFGLDNVSLSLAGGSQFGDFNGDGVLGIDDLNLLSDEIALADPDPRYDVDQSGVVDLADRQHWVTDIKRTWMGDSNFDGQFNSADLVAVFTASEYEDGIALNSTWSTGDWNGDREFDTADLVAAFTDRGYEAGPRAAVSAVPEPSSLVLLVCSVLVIGCRRSRGFGP